MSPRSGAVCTLIHTIRRRLMRLIGTGDNADVRVMQEPMMVQTIISHHRLIRAPRWAPLVAPCLSNAPASDSSSSGFVSGRGTMVRSGLNGVLGLCIPSSHCRTASEHHPTSAWVVLRVDRSAQGTNGHPPPCLPPLPPFPFPLSYPLPFHPLSLLSSPSP